MKPKIKYTSRRAIAKKKKEKENTPWQVDTLLNKRENINVNINDKNNLHNVINLKTNEANRCFYA